MPTPSTEFALDPTTTDAVHALLSLTARSLKDLGVPNAVAAQLMLGYAAAWAAKSAPEVAAENLYRCADALIGNERDQSRH